MENAFKARAERYAAEAEKISAVFNGTAELGEIRYTEYDGRISQSEAAVNELSDMLENGGRYLFAAETGSGKTYAVAEAFRQNTKEEDEGFFDVNYTNILLLPSRTQTQQFQAEYGIKGIVGGVNITAEEISGGNFASVYDKAGDFADFLEAQKTEWYAEHRVNVVIDEAHLLVQAAYRTAAIEQVNRLAAAVERTGGSVIFTTASFAALLPYSFRRTVFCVRKNAPAVPATEIWEETTGASAADAVLRAAEKIIAEGGSAYIRINNKEAAAACADAVEKKTGRKCYIISADEKTKENGHFVNPAMESLVSEGVLPEAPAYFVTSVIDAGTNIKGIRRADGTVCTPESVFPVYVMTGRETNTDNIEQSFARIRFAVKKRAVLMVQAPEHLQQYADMSLAETAAEEYAEAESLRKPFADLLEILTKNEGAEKAAEMVRAALAYIDDDGNSVHRGYIKVSGGAAVIDPAGFYRAVRERIYMSQFAYAEPLSEELSAIFGTEVSIGPAPEGTAQVEKETPESRRAALAEIAADDGRYNDFAAHTGADWKKYGHTEEAELASRMVMQDNDLRTAMEQIGEMTQKQAREAAREADREKTELLTAEQRKQAYAALTHAEYIPAEKAAAEWASGHFRELASRAAAAGMTAKQIFTAAEETHTDAELRSRITDWEAVQINRALRAGLPAAGPIAAEQKAASAAAEAERTGRTLTVKAGSKAAENIKKAMHRATGKTVSDAHMFTVLARTYTHRTNADGSLTLYGKKY